MPEFLSEVCQAVRSIESAFYSDQNEHQICHFSLRVNTRIVGDHFPLKIEYSS